MKVTNTHVFFYGGFISNFAPANFTWTMFDETHQFFCSEQAFMWAKAKYFKDEETAAAILKEDSDPMTCKSLGRMVQNYNEDEWAKVRYDYMLKVNFEKYRQNKPMLEALLDKNYTGKLFVEASPTDCIWGIGLGLTTAVKTLDNERKWHGTNLLGKVITEVRDTLLNEVMN